MLHHGRGTRQTRAAEQAVVAPVPQVEDLAFKQPARAPGAAADMRHVHDVIGQPPARQELDAGILPRDRHKARHLAGAVAPYLADAVAAEQGLRGAPFQPVGPRLVRVRAGAHDARERVRRVALQMLERAGYRTLAASNGLDAVRLLQQWPEPIHLVLLDVVMPETDGVELAEQILAHRPGQRIIFMSAYPAEVLAEHGLQDLDVVFLAKPYTMDELRAKVAQAMERPPSPQVDPVWRAQQEEKRRQDH